MKYLFVGGPADGDRKEVPDGVTHTRVVTPNDKAVDYDASPEARWISPNERMGKVYVYERRPYHGDAKRFDIFVFAGMGGDSAMEKLIENYHPTPPTFSPIRIEQDIAMLIAPSEESLHKQMREGAMVPISSPAKMKYFSIQHHNTVEQWCAIVAMPEKRIDT